MKKLAAAALLSTLSVNAWGYIPPSGFVIKSLASKHASFAGLQVKSTVQVFDSSGKPTDHRFKVVTVYNSAEGQLFSYATDATDRKLFFSEQKPGSLPAAAALLLSNNSKNIAQSLKTLGIVVGPVSQEPLPEPEPSSNPKSPRQPLPPEALGGAGEGMQLHRWKESTAWVLNGNTDSQLWIEKDTFLPVRLLLNKEYEVRFDSTRFYKEFPFPKLVSLLRPGNLLQLQDEITEVLVYPENHSIKSPTLPGIKALAAGLSPGLTEEGRAAPGPLREALQQYYEYVR